MAITGFINLLTNFFQSIWGVLHGTKIYAYGFNASIGDILLVCVILGMVLSIYWKGAKG